MRCRRSHVTVSAVTVAVALVVCLLSSGLLREDDPTAFGCSGARCLRIHTTSGYTAAVMPNSDEGAKIAEATAAATLSPTVNVVNNTKLRGVILFLYGGRWHDYFVRATLPSLAAYFLRCHPYPVHIFHEGVTAAVKGSIRDALTRHGVARPVVDYEDVSDTWKSLPPGVSEQELKTWMQTGVQSKFQGRGYRVMCRFWAGLVWQRSSMDKYDYYWRLDTDSILTRPVIVDIFHHVFIERRCEYGYNRLKGENPFVAERLWDTFVAWARRDNLSATRWRAVRRFAMSDRPNPDPATQLRLAASEHNPSEGELKYFWAPMFYNNFELGSFRLKRDPLYSAFFTYVDTQQPYGIFRHRWGDAPLHTLGVMAVLSGQGLCNVSQRVVGYRHAVKHPPTVAVPTASCIDLA